MSLGTCVTSLEKIKNGVKMSRIEMDRRILAMRKEIAKTYTNPDDMYKRLKDILLRGRC